MGLELVLDVIQKTTADINKIEFGDQVFERGTSQFDKKLKQMEKAVETVKLHLNRTEWRQGGPEMEVYCLEIPYAEENKPEKIVKFWLDTKSY